ncbi:MAG: response regulator transcription factor [Spirochaetales bacterium]|nr:response regulator transcription factor [Spirochaetales bacterium]
MDRILIVDDDKKLQSLLVDYLRDAGYEPAGCYDGSAALIWLREHSCDLIILDIMMPGMDGLAVLRELRKASDVPVIMLTARGDDMDRIVGLELGADDYLPKPFNPRELLARIKAVRRREKRQTLISSANQITIGDLRYHRNQHRLDRGPEVCQLSQAEGRLLEVLMEHADEVVSREAIMQATQGREFMGFERSIDVHVSKLRLKLETLGAGRNRIQTIRGSGYRFLSGADA